METPSHRRSLGSNFCVVENSSGIIPDKEKPWNLQRRNTPLVKISVKKARIEQDDKIDRLSFLTEKETFGTKKYLVVKKIGKQFAPIGFRKLFSDIDSLKTFAVQESRQIVRIIGGKKPKDFIIENNSNEEVVVDTTPIIFNKNGRGQKLWNAKRGKINGYGKTKKGAELDLIATEKEIAIILNS